MKLLEEVFAIDIAAYAVMSNHYHVVLHVDQIRGRSWGREHSFHAGRTRLAFAPPLTLQLILTVPIPECQVLRYLLDYPQPV